MTQANLDIIINAKNKSRPAIDQVKNDLAGIDRTAQTLSGGMGTLLAGAGIAGIGVLATQLAGVAMELGRTGAMADQTHTAFEGLAAQAGTSGGQILGALRAASRGTVSEMDLMLAANRGMLLGVADSADEFSQLMQIAEARAKAMGISTTQAFGNIVTGIGRMSPLILDNLGIVVDGEAAFAAYAESVGKAADQLTDAERKQALLNQVVANSADIVAANNAAGANMVDQFERMDAALQNAKQAMGELFGPAVAQIAGQIADATVRATEAMREQAAINAENSVWANGDEITRTMEEIERMSQRMRDAALAGDGEQLLYSSMRIQQLRQDVADLAAEYNAAAAVTGAPLIDVGALMHGEIAFQNAGDAITEMGNDAVAATQQVASLLDQLDRAQASVDAMKARTAEQGAAGLRGIAAGLVGGQGAAQTLHWYEQQNDALNQQIGLWREIYADEKYIADVLVPGYLSGLRDANREVTTMAQSLPQISEEWRNLQSAVQGVLSSGLDPGVGVDAAGILEGMGLRPDAINEDARRLADVAVNGFESPWLDYFRSEFPALFDEAFDGADPKAAAAQLLLDFQDGLRPELLDKERAKELVKRALLGDANMAALADEIAGELAAELGVSLYDAQQAAASALGTTRTRDSVADAAQVGDALLPVGMDAASVFADGFDLALIGIGVRVASTLNGEILGEAVLKQIDGTGRGAGSAWGDGFLSAVGENVPAALVDILFLRVLPLVQGAQATEAALQGAQ